MQGESQAGQDAPVLDEATQQAPITEQVDTTKPDTQDGEAKEEKTAVAPKTFTEEEVQERIERATAKAAAKAERRAFREANDLLQRTQAQVQPQQVTDDKPRRDQFADEESYLDKLTDWKLDQRDRGTRQQSAQQAQQSLTQKTEKIYAEAEKIPGFDRDDFEALPLTPAIASAITDSDVAAKLMAHLASNPDEVERIAKLAPARQAAEIGKLETKLATVAKPPKAPAPIEPINGGNTVINKSLEKTNMDDFIAQRRKAGSRWIR